MVLPLARAAVISTGVRVLQVIPRHVVVGLEVVVHHLVRVRVRARARVRVRVRVRVRARVRVRVRARARVRVRARVSMTCAQTVMSPLLKG